MSGVAFENPVPSIGLSRASLDFGSVNSGQTKDPKVTIGNGGSATLTVNSITGGAPRFSVVSPPLPVAIAAGQSADVTVRFSPNAGGAVSGTLSISRNDHTRPAVTIALSGSGAAAAPVISVAPALIDFGAVIVGQTRDSKITIGNSGNADLTVRSISSGSAAFTVVSPVAPFTVAAGASTDATIRFAPAAPGPASSTLTLLSNYPVRLSLTIALSGSNPLNALSSLPTAPAPPHFATPPL